MNRLCFLGAAAGIAAVTALPPLALRAAEPPVEVWEIWIKALRAGDVVRWPIPLGRAVAIYLNGKLILQTDCYCGGGYLEYTVPA